MLQEAISQASEIVYARRLDDVVRGTPEDPAADRSSDDAIITASRIMLSMAATIVIEKEQHHSTSHGWRSIVSENHGCVVVHRGINFPSSGSDAESNDISTRRSCHESNRRGTVET